MKGRQIFFDIVDRGSFEVSLSGVNCFLTIWWQEVDQSWYLTFEAPKGTTIHRGKRLSSDSPLKCKLSSEKKGLLIVKDKYSSPPQDPFKGSWGDRHSLHWIPL